MLSSGVWQFKSMKFWLGKKSLWVCGKTTCNQAGLLKFVVLFKFPVLVFFFINHRLSDRRSDMLTMRPEEFLHRNNSYATNGSFSNGAGRESKKKGRKISVEQNISTETLCHLTIL